jgi:tetratricopeptide (TPR) repeat protein
MQDMDAADASQHETGDGAEKRIPMGTHSPHKLAGALNTGEGFFAGTGTNRVDHRREMSGPLSLGIAVLLFWVFAYVRILIHELGHLIAASAFGWKLLTLVVGTGPEKSFGRMGNVEVRFGARPFGGLTRVVPLQFGLYRFKFLIFVICGPLANALLIVSMVAIYRAFDLDQWPEWVTVVLGLSFYHEVAFLIGNLIPHEVRRYDRKLSSDGLQIWNCLTKSRSELESNFNNGLVAYAEMLLKAGKAADARRLMEDAFFHVGPQTDPARITFWIRVLLVLGRQREALEESEKVIAGVDRLEAPVIQTLDQLACIPIFGDHPEFLPVATKCIDEAIQREPQTITLKGTKGSLLIENGNLAEGVPMLEEVRRESESENDQAICSYYLAYACYKKGDTSGAVEQLRLSKEKYPQCLVASRIEKKILAPV